MRSAFAASLQQLLAALLLLAAVTGPASAQTKHAILVGVNVYEKRGFRDLLFAERDVDELAEVLKQSGYQVTKLTASTTDASLRATLTNVQLHINRLLTNRTKQDLVLVGLAGHGFQLEVPGADGKRQADAFYCPVDAERGNPSTMLSIGSLLEQIDTRGGGRNLLLIDACREDPTRGRGLDGTTVKTLPEGVAVMFGCGAGQKTYESKNAGGGHGIFFHYVIEGLKGGAKNDRGEVTWSRLSEYVTEQVVQHAPKLLDDSNVVQEPNPILNIRGVSPVISRIRFEGVYPGEERVDNDLGMKFCWIPPGDFQMGSPDSELERMYFEKQVSVTISSGFWMGKYEVTQHEYATIMKENRSSTTPNGGWPEIAAALKGRDLSRFPVDSITWNEAAEFCRRLTASERNAKRLPEGWVYRLPTEAEWEYACRAGTTTPFHLGNSISSHQANVNGEYPYGTEQKGPRYGMARDVGAYPANPWGLHDMHGNVLEICYDSWDGESALLGGVDPVGVKGEKIVTRGGDSRTPGWKCRSAYRDWYHGKDHPYSFNGFRVVKGHPIKLP